MQVEEAQPYTDTEIVIYGLEETMSDERLAGVLGGGQKVRWINRLKTMAFVAYHRTEDAKLGLLTAAMTIRLAGSTVTTVIKAFFQRSASRPRNRPIWRTAKVQTI